MFVVGSFFFFFKQKTAYEMRISDWSSDVCSSDLYYGLSPGLDFESKLFAKPNAAALLEKELSRKGYEVAPIAMGTNTDPYQPIEQIGRASCRERVCQYV